MTSLESHGHRLAKQLLVSWFREEAAGAAGDGWSTCGVYARPNRSGPFWGVFEEYPICSHQLPGYPVWDEEDWCDRWQERFGRLPDDAAEMVSTCDDNFGPNSWASRPPTREELLQIGPTPLLVLDIMCQHKGNIAFGIEIVHKNPVSEYKAEILSRCEFPVLEVKSSWILAQVAIPNRLVCTRVFGTANRYCTPNIEMWRGVA